MELFRLAEVLRVPDPEMLKKKLPHRVLMEWSRYFSQKEREYTKLEYYLVQICRQLASITGAEPRHVVFPRDDEAAAGTAVETVHISAEGAAGVLRAAFGV